MESNVYNDNSLRTRTIRLAVAGSNVVPRDLLPQFADLDLEKAIAETLPALSLHVRLEANGNNLETVRECIYDQFGQMLEYHILTRDMVKQAQATGEIIHVNRYPRIDMNARERLYQ